VLVDIGRRRLGKGMAEGRNLSACVEGEKNGTARDHRKLFALSERDEMGLNVLRMNDGDGHDGGGSYG